MSQCIMGNGHMRTLLDRMTYPQLRLRAGKRKFKLSQSIQTTALNFQTMQSQKWVHNPLLNFSVHAA